ncbi:MAG TPA: NUDIX domain-containing protein [Chloroflexota bacterium]|nr:NUDIX domain-containing protein [Chloroflexota bacterium]
MEGGKMHPGRMIIRPGVAAIVRDPEGRILLHQRRGEGKWAPPSGTVEPGESLVQALQRELIEETGLVVAVERLVGLYSDPAYQIVRYPNGQMVHFVTALFTVRARGDAFWGSDEGVAWDWFKPDALPADLLPYAVVWISDALAGAAEPLIR